MNYLLDTHVLLWSIFEKKKIPAKVRSVLQDTQNEVLVSAVSLWEISLKYRLGKLDFHNFDPLGLPGICDQMQFTLLPLSPTEAASYHFIKSDFHKDPFDRMLIRQAIQHQLALVSADFHIAQYIPEGLKVFWD